MRKHYMAAFATTIIFAVSVGNLYADTVEKALEGPIRTEEGVRAVQISLNESGYDAGAPDGIIGKQTRKALREWFERRRHAHPSPSTPAVYGYVTLLFCDRGKTPKTKIIWKRDSGALHQVINCEAGSTLELAGGVVPCGSTLVHEPGALLGGGSIVLDC